MSGMAYEKSNEVLCEECDSTEVTAMGEMTWDPKWNQWEPTGEIDHYYCGGKCNAKTQVIYREVRE